jgi:hypothetical protein
MNRLRVRRIGATGRLGPASSVWTGGSGVHPAPKLAVARSGAAVMVWSSDLEDGSVLLARRMGAGGRLGPIRTLAVEPDALPGERSHAGDEWRGLDEQLAVDSAGNAIVAWTRSHGHPSGDPRGGYDITDSTVRLRRFNADGSLGPIEDIPPGETRLEWYLPAKPALDSFPRLAIGPSGRGVLWWQRQGYDNQVLARRIGSDLRLGASFEITRNVGVTSLDAGVDVKGRVTFAWQGTVEGEVSVVARHLPSRGGLSAVHTLDRRDGNVPRLVVDRHGTATVTWHRFPGRDFGSAVMARRLHANGTMEPLKRLSGPTEEVGWPQIAIDGAGRATVVWDEWIAGGRDGRTRVRARAFTPLGRLGGRFTLAAWKGYPRGLGVVADTRGVVTAAFGAPGAVRARQFVPRRAVAR